MARKDFRGDNPFPYDGGGYMKGSVQKDKRTGNHYIKLYLDGKQVAISTDKKTNKSIKSEEHAQKVLSIIQSEIDDGTFDREDWKLKRGIAAKKHRSVQTVKQYSKKWLKKRKELCDAGEIVPRTLKDDKTAVNKYIIKYYSHKSLNQITKKNILEFYNKINLSKAGKYNIVSTFRKMLNDAKEDGFMESVPEFPKLNKKSKQAKKYMTPEQQNKVISKINNFDKPIFQIMRQYGLRPSEARALKKSSVRDGEIYIEWSYSENLLRNTTKTGEPRSYCITPYVQNILNNIPNSKSEFLFVRRDGKPYTSKNLNKIWRQACKEANIPHFKMYNAMRHSLARNLLENGHGMDMVSEVLGHASVEITKEFYADMPMNIVHDALNGLSESQDW